MIITLLHNKNCMCWGCVRSWRKKYIPELLIPGSTCTFLGTTDDDIQRCLDGKNIDIPKEDWKAGSPAIKKFEMQI